MVIWQWINDYLPPYAEQITINDEVEQIQETLNQFKQLVPDNFIQVETDYNFTTKSKWSKPLSERYSFEYEGEWFYIDIPHTVMEKLELEKGKEIIWPLHLNPEVLERKPTCGGVTIENEKEIFLEKPFTVENLGEDIKSYYDKINELKDKKDELVKKNKSQREKLTKKDDRIKQLEESEKQKKEEIKRYDTRLTTSLEKEKEIFELLGNYSNKETSIERINDLISRLNKVSETNNKVANFLNFNENKLKEVGVEIKGVSHIPVLSYLLEEYRKEKFWWNKWMGNREIKINDINDPLLKYFAETFTKSYVSYQLKINNVPGKSYIQEISERQESNEVAPKRDTGGSGKIALMCIYRYYRDK